MEKATGPTGRTEKTEEALVQRKNVRGHPDTRSLGQASFSMGFWSRAFRAVPLKLQCACEDLGLLFKSRFTAKVWGGACDSAFLAGSWALAMLLVLGPHVEEQGLKGGINGNSTSPTAHLDNGLPSSFYRRPSIFQTIFHAPF